MRILLDTHVLLWALGNRRRLDAATLATLEDPANEVLFSVASIWEIAIKRRLDRSDFSLNPREIADAALNAGFVELPLLTGAACLVAELPLLHRDPFDRILIAQAIAEPAVLFTADDQLPPYSQLVKRVASHRR